MARKKTAKPKKWLSKAIKRPGALKAAARRAGALKADGTIKVSWLRQQAKAKGRRGQQARLALTMREMG